ncbi:MAG: LysE family translocator [Pseudomonadota bacterium]
MSFELWLTFVAASTALLLIPGPTVLLVITYALSRGRGVALACAGGVALGDLIAMSASLAGLGALILASAKLFLILKWVGAIYLIWLGWKLLRQAGTSTIDPAQGGETHDRNVFWHAAAVTALNPKSIAFFIAFVPQFVSADQPLMPQFSILVGTFVGLAGLNALAYALLADRLRKTINRPAVNRTVTRLGGFTLIGMGILTATIRRAA